MRRKSPNLTALRGPPVKPSGPSTTRSARSTIAAGPSSERTPTLTAGHEPSSASKASRSVTSSPANRAAREVVAADELLDRLALVDLDRRPDLEHLAPPVDQKPLGLGLLRDALEARPGGILVRHSAPVQRHDRPLVLDPDAEQPEVALVAGQDELLDARSPVRERRENRGLRLAGLEQLGAVRARVGDRADADQPARLGGRAPGDAGDEGVAASQRTQQPRRLLRHLRILGAAHDRRQRAVDVEQDPGARRVCRDWLERLGEHAASLVCGGPRSASRGGPSGVRECARAV